MSLRDTLSQLEELQTPAGVAARDFNLLKEALRQALLHRGVLKLPCTAPVDQRSRVDDLAVSIDIGSPIATWTYRNLGDYDQDGKVALHDLTLLGIHFGKDATALDWTAARVADGNRDGKVDIADVQAIGIGYGKCITGYHFEYRRDGEAPWELVANSALAAVPSIPEQPRRMSVFQFAGDYAVKGLPAGDYRVTPYDGESTGIPSVIFYYDRGGQTPHFESEDNDAWETADVLPELPITGSGTAGSLGVGNPYGDDDGDMEDWYRFKAHYAGACIISVHTPESAIPVQVELAQQLENGTLGGCLAAGNSVLEKTLDQPGDYYIRLHTDAAAQATEYFLTISWNLEIENIPPHAALTATPQWGSAPLQVMIDASSSRDYNADDAIVMYEFDFGDGAGYTDYGATAAVQHTYATAGEHLAKVRVTDSHGASDSTAVEVSTAGAIENTWKVLIWLAGDNNLAASHYSVIQELERQPSNQAVTVLVGYDIDPAQVTGSGCDKVRFIRITPDDDLASINTSGDPANVSYERSGYDSSDPAHIREFVDWAQQFPAGHTILFLADHGSGWDGGVAKAGLAVDQRQPSAILIDDRDGSGGATPNQAIAEALVPYHFDLLYLHACLMGDIESLYDFHTMADYIIASPPVVWTTGYEISSAVEKLRAYPASNLGDACKLAVPGSPGSGYYGPFMLFDCANIALLVEQMGTLTDLVRTNAAVESNPFQRAVSQLPDVGFSHWTRDLQGFLEQYRVRTENPEIIQALDSTLAALNDATVVNTLGDGIEYARGITVFLPDRAYLNSLYAFDGSPFDKATGWLEMLRATGAPLTDGTPDYTADWQPGDMLVAWWNGISNDVDLGVTAPNGIKATPADPAPLLGQVLFGPDNPSGGACVEYTFLQPGAMAGNYRIWLRLNNSTNPSFAPVAGVKLFNSDGELKADFGTCEMWPGKPRVHVELHCE